MWNHPDLIYLAVIFSAAGLALLVGCLCLLGAAANHSTPQRYRRKGTIREHDAGGDDAFGYR